MNRQVYVVIDSKSFYASVECVERCLDPLNTNRVVSDKSRTDKTICLAVSPSLKIFGIVAYQIDYILIKAAVKRPLQKSALRSHTIAAPFKILVGEYSFVAAIRIGFHRAYLREIPL